MKTLARFKEMGRRNNTAISNVKNIITRVNVIKSDAENFFKTEYLSIDAINLETFNVIKSLNETIIDLSHGRNSLWSNATIELDLILRNQETGLIYQENNQKINQSTNNVKSINKVCGDLENNLRYIKGQLLDTITYRLNNDGTIVLEILDNIQTESKEILENITSDFIKKSQDPLPRDMNFDFLYKATINNEDKECIGSSQIDN